MVSYPANTILTPVAELNRIPCELTDISLVPTLDLPLQSILFFQPCSPPVAASYLQGLCLAEGCLLDRHFLLELCESTRQIDTFDMPDSPQNPLTKSLPVPDLKRAIHHLQLWTPIGCAVEPQTAEIHAFSSCTKTRDECLDLAANPTFSASGAEKQMRGVISHAEILSFIDSYLTRRPLDTPDVSVFCVNLTIDLT
jgi:hypothetical protein